MPFHPLAMVALAFLGIFPPIVAHSTDDFASMGPMGFMWPADREWLDDEHAMRGPCGSPAGPINRTVFPLTNGALALEQKQAVFDVQVSVSMTDDPSDASDFDVLIPHNDIASLAYSHVCIDIPDMPEAAAGRNATIRLQYVAEHIDPDHEHVKRHMPVNETFFACADVTLAGEGFEYDDIPCFNITADFDSQDDGHSHDADDGEEEESTSSSASGPDLSSGAIAGIVIGSIVGVVVMGTALWYFIRRDRREKQMVERMTGAAVGSKSISESVRQVPA